MRLMIAVFAMPLLLAGCAVEGKHSDSYKVKNLDNCGDGGSWVNVHYGDSQLKVKPKEPDPDECSQTSKDVI